MSLLSIALPPPLILASRPDLQRKFTPASADVAWERIQHLVMTAGTRGEVFGDGNSAAFACLMTLSTGAIEPPLRLWKEQDPTKREIVPDHAILPLITNKPNTFHHSLRELLFWKTWCQHVEGNAYFLKQRSGNANKGNVVALWPLSPTICAPYTARGSTNYIDSYRRWDTDTRQWIDEPVENIVHFRLGVDDRDHRKGLAPLQRLVREVASDDAATRWTDRMLAIGGAASMMVTVPKDSDLTPEEIEAMRTRVEQRFTGERVGSVGVLAGGAVANRYGFSPSEMDLGALHNVPETRICAAIGVHPAVAMLGVGLNQTANYSSLKEVYIAFTERKLVPLWVSDEDALNHSLLPDFTSDKKLLLAYDQGKVRALQEDVNALWARATAAWDKGAITLDQFCTLVGLELAGGEEGKARKGAGASTPALPDGQQPPQDNQQQGNNQNQGNKPPAGNKPQDNQGDNAPKALDVKATDLGDWPQLMDALRDLAEPAFEAEVQSFFDDQKRRIKRNVLRAGAVT